MKAIDCPFTKIITDGLQRVRAGDGAGAAIQVVSCSGRSGSMSYGLSGGALSERRDGEHIRRIAG
jgi:hypothetical protein